MTDPTDDTPQGPAGTPREATETSHEAVETSHEAVETSDDAAERPAEVAETPHEAALGTLGSSGPTPDAAGMALETAGMTPEPTGTTSETAGTTPAITGMVADTARMTPETAGATHADAAMTPDTAAMTPGTSGATDENAGTAPDTAGTTPEGDATGTPTRSSESPAEEDFAALLAATERAAPAQRRIAMGDRVRGRVVAIGHESAFVTIGAKSEATISLEEFRDPTSGELHLAVGDQLEATVTDDGSRSGAIVLKRTLGRGGHVPGELEQALAHGIPVEGLVTGQNKGGFDVQVAGQRAFCPASQIDLRRGDPAQYVGQRFRFRVTRIEGAGRNIVVARRPLLEEEAAARAASTWQRLEVGAVVQGTVVSLRDFGAFVDLGGVEGLIHVSELGHGKTRHPSELLEIGQTVEAQVVKLEPDPGGGRGRIGLSLRALAPDPWTTASERFPAGTTLRGKVRRLEPFGAFVELAPGIDGLVHVSRMALDRRVSHPKQVVQVGDEVEVTVVAVEPDKRRIALSMVESARREREAGEVAERRETAMALDKSREGRSFGTLADLISTSRKRDR